jgi:gamma-glutamyltranspeptidase/glutathione hydrolase
LIDNFSDSQIVGKRVVATRGGVVAAQHKRAAEVGAAVLEAGGDAVDAAVATSFAIGVVEPWMSGLAAGGVMVLWRAEDARPVVVDYGMRSPRALDPADYPLAGAGKAQDLFAWPLVKDDRNVEGATAVAVPGVVAGMALAHRHFGRLPWRDLVAPAAALADEGMLLDWFAGLLIASSARSLAKDPDAAAHFLEDGTWAPLGTWAALTEKRLDQRRLAASLREIADRGPAAFYGGDVGRALAADVRAKGGSLDVADLEAYAPSMAKPLVVPYRGGRILAAPGMTGGPTLARAFGTLARLLAPHAGAPGAGSYVAYAKALDEAWRARLAGMGDTPEPPTAPTCTTHFSVVDRHGNLCSVTQTLLSVFGSRVVSPSTGILLNNGIMWFDPEPGKPNSLAPGKRCLGNYCPVIGETAGGDRFAIGASGGRKIVGTVLQLASFMLDHGLDLEAAFHQPRIDMSGNDAVVADRALPADVIDALGTAFPTTTVRRLPFPYAFACPAGVVRSGSLNAGCTEVQSPWGDAVAERVAGV